MKKEYIKATAEIYIIKTNIITESNVDESGSDGTDAPGRLVLDLEGEE